ncbi:MAG TPA: GatB/YqeY domain-containing protein [Candidatus Deferrimicrobiaceae bacterium]
MSLNERLRQDMQKAAKERDSLALSALRMALSELKYKEIEAHGELPDEAVIKLLASMVKRRRESIDMYTKGNRPDLVAQESAEIKVLEVYLPQGISEAEVEAIVRETVAAEGAKGVADMGRVMKALMPKIAGRADGKVVNEIVRRVLAG